MTAAVHTFTSMLKLNKKLNKFKLKKEQKIGEPKIPSNNIVMEKFLL
jgi:hypothetical protein